MRSVWLVFCDCGFHSVHPLIRIRIRVLWKLPDGRDWLWGKLGLVLMGGAMLSKSLIQFSVDGRGCVPSLLFDLRPNCPGDNEDNGDPLQKVPGTLPHSMPLTLQQATADPCLCWRFLDTHRQVWVNFLGVLSPFVRSPGWEICCGF